MQHHAVDIGGINKGMYGRESFFMLGKFHFVVFEIHQLQFSRVYEKSRSSEREETNLDIA